MIDDEEVREFLPALRLLDEHVDRRPILGEQRDSGLHGDELRERPAVSGRLVEHRRVLALVEDRRGERHRHRDERRHRQRPADAERDHACLALAPRILVDFAGDADQRLRELFARLVALFRRLLQRAGDHAAQRQRQVGPQRIERRRVGVGDLVDDADHRVALERQVPGEHLVEHDARRKQVRARIDGKTLDLLGRHVVGRSQHRAHLRLIGLLRLLGLVDPADAEVGDFHRERLVHQHDVAGLDVAMDDAFLVRVVERAGELDADLDDLLAA